MSRKDEAVAYWMSHDFFISKTALCAFLPTALGTACLIELLNVLKQLCFSIPKTHRRAALMMNA